MSDSDGSLNGVPWTDVDQLACRSWGEQLIEVAAERVTRWRFRPIARPDSTVEFLRPSLQIGPTMVDRKGNQVRFSPYANRVYKITYDRVTGECINRECANVAPFPTIEMLKWRDHMIVKHPEPNWTLEQAREYLEGI